MIRVIIADDHPLIREGIRKMIDKSLDIEAVGEAGDAEELLALIADCSYDVIILDINMPGMGGIEAIEHLTTIDRDVRIVVLSMLPERDYAVRVLKAGARGYVSKGNAPKELIEAVRKVASGGRYVNQSLLDDLAFAISEGTHEDISKLSNREMEVMKQLAIGKSIKEISNEIHLSDRTISTYRTRILQKLHLDNNAQIVRFAITNGIIE